MAASVIVLTLGGATARPPPVAGKSCRVICKHIPAGEIAADWMMLKFDVESAFRLLPIQTKDIPLVGFCLPKQRHIFSSPTSVRHPKGADNKPTERYWL